MEKSSWYLEPSLLLTSVFMVLEGTLYTIRGESVEEKRTWLQNPSIYNGDLPAGYASAVVDTKIVGVNSHYLIGIRAYWDGTHA